MTARTRQLIAVRLGRMLVVDETAWISPTEQYRGAARGLGAIGLRCWSSASPIGAPDAGPRPFWPGLEDDLAGVPEDVADAMRTMHARGVTPELRTAVLTAIRGEGYYLDRVAATNGRREPVA